MRLTLIALLILSSTAYARAKDHCAIEVIDGQVTIRNCLVMPSDSEVQSGIHIIVRGQNGNFDYNYILKDKADTDCERKEQGE